MKKFIKKSIILIINSFIFFLKFFIKKKNNYLIFSSGDTFSGNPKYLYLYCSNEKNLNCYWFSGNRKIINYLKSKKLKTVYRWSIKAIYLTLISKYFFISSGTKNICEYKIIKDTEVINLWHGTPIKKIFYDEKKTDIEFINHLKNHLNSFNHFITGSENLIDQFKNSIRNPNIILHPFGMPANDILYRSKEDLNFKDIIINKIKNQFSIDQNQKIILYCPTHRDYFEDYDINYLNSFYKKILIFCEDNNFILLNKFHPLRIPTIDPIIYKNEFFLDITSYDDIQEFLISTDLLITDYSSVIFDYSILEKPFILFQYDIEKYSDRREFYYSWDIFPTEITYKTEDLIQKINQNKFFDNDKNITFYKNFNIGDNSCKRILEKFFSKKIDQSNFYEKKYDLIRDIKLINRDNIY